MKRVLLTTLGGLGKAGSFWAAMIPLFLFLLVPLTYGCAGWKTTRSPMMKQAPEEVRKNIQMSPEELVIHIRALSNQYAGVIIHAADRIMAESTDPRVRHNALVWKMNAIPASFGAVFQTDPLLALLDILAFSFQMQTYFETGLGRDAFGPWQPVALEAVRDLNQRTLALVEKGGSPGEEGPLVVEVRNWALEHPIENEMFVRDSVASLYADVIRHEDVGTLAAMGRLSYDLDTLTAQLTAYTDSLPPQVRWQAELLIEELMPREEIKALLQEVAGANQALDRATTVLEEVPVLVARERALLLQALIRERVAVLASIDQQRVTTLNWLQAEIDSTGSRFTDQLGSRMENLIDHVFLRAAQLLGGLFLLVLLSGMLLARRIARVRK